MAINISWRAHHDVGPLQTTSPHKSPRSIFQVARPALHSGMAETDAEREGDRDKDS